MQPFKTGLFAIIIFILSVPGPTHLFGDDAGEKQIQTIHVNSTSLNREMTYTVVLPAHYDVSTAENEPFLLFLHGRGRNERSLLDDPIGRTALLKTNRVILFPRGDRSWWIDSPVHSQEHYGQWLDEVLADATQRFHLSQDSSNAALAGWSMGGYGAARFMESHAARFGSIVLIIALVDYPTSPDHFPAGQSYPVHPDELGSDPDLWPELNPIRNAEAFRGKRILLISGQNAFDLTMNKHFAARLTELGIEHTFEVVPGDHSFDLVCRQLDRAFDFLQSSPTTLPSPERNVIGQ